MKNIYEDYDIDRLQVEMLKLIDEVRDIKKRIKMTPFYRIRDRWKLYKEWKNVTKRTDDIGKRMKKIQRSPIQIVAKE